MVKEPTYESKMTNCLLHETNSSSAQNLPSYVKKDNDVIQTQLPVVKIRKVSRISLFSGSAPVIKKVTTNMVDKFAIASLYF